MVPTHVERRHLVLATAGCAALAVVGLVDPSRHALGPPCPLRALTGLDCPLCGATRATHALLRADLGTALDFNALYVVLLPVVAVVAAFWFVRGRPPGWTTGAGARRTLAAVGVAFLVVRNLPWEPFARLGT